MDNKREINIPVAGIVLVLIAIVVIGVIVYKISDRKTIDTASNTVNNTIIETNTEPKEDIEVSYIEIQIEDIETEEREQQGLAYKNKKITDKKQIDEFMKIIDNATEYKLNSFIPEFGDCPPTAKITLSNGESYTVLAGDEIDDAGNIVNLMNKWDTEDGSNKSTYKLNIKLGQYIVNLFGEEKYNKLTNNLNEDSVMYVTNVKENTDATYTLQGVAYMKIIMSSEMLEDIANRGVYEYHNEKYTVKKDYLEPDSSIKYDYVFLRNWQGEERLALYANKKEEDLYYIQNTTENSDEWQKTSVYHYLTVDANVVVENGEENVTVKDVFKNFNKIDEEEIYPPTPSYTFEFENGECTKIIEHVLGY